MSEELKREDFLKPVFRQEELGEAKQVAQKYQSAKFIFIIGIGGSNLATKAVYNALTLHEEKNKKIFFLESPDSREYEEIDRVVKEDIQNIGDFVLIAISKSGETRETLEGYDKTFEILQSKFGADIKSRILIISSPGNSLSQKAEGVGAEKINWQGEIGGRFSAFTLTHLLPLQIIGLDIQKFLEGGREAGERFDDSLAQKIFASNQKGVGILDFFIFNSELEDLGKWGRQLIAESLSLITPTVSIGPTDLHSMLELYLGGPKNRFTIFIRSKEEIGNGVNQSAYENAVQAYEGADLPYQKFEMENITEKELGKFMAFMMLTVVSLAKLINNDPYDQPAVEKYKAQVRKAQA